MDNEIHDERIETQEGFEVHTLAAYVNDDQITGDMIYQETEEEKKERMAVIGNSLEITKLENAIDAELTRKLKVKDTEERIKRLREVLILLQEHTMTADLKTENELEKEEKDEYHGENQKNENIAEK